MVRRTVRRHGSRVLTDNLYRIECTVRTQTSHKDGFNLSSTVTEQNHSLLLIHEFIWNNIQINDVNSCD